MKLFAKFMLVCVIVSAVSSVFANAWGYHGPKRDVVTLIVIANYEQPRLLAELIQSESRQPYLLIPAKDKGNIFFCPPIKYGESKVVPRDTFSRTISFIAPQKIIVLGNNSYVPDYYVNALRKIAPVYVIDGETWQSIADSLAPMLNLARLSNNYRKLSSELTEGKVYIPKPVSRKNAKVTQNQLILDSAPASSTEESFDVIEIDSDDTVVDASTTDANQDALVVDEM